MELIVRTESPFFEYRKINKNPNVFLDVRYLRKDSWYSR